MISADASDPATTHESRSFTPLDPQDKALLDERLADLTKNPDSGEPWEQVLAELRTLL